MVQLNVISSAAGSNKLSLEVEPEDSIAAVKESIKAILPSSGSGSSSDDVKLRLIFAGRILKDEETVEGSKLGNGATVHLVRLGGSSTAAPSATAAPVSTAASTSPTIQPSVNPMTSAMFRGAPLGGFAPNPQAMGNATSLPMVDPSLASQMMTSNPELMRQSMEFLVANPGMLQTILNSDPRFASMPPEMRQMMSNPEMLRMMLSMSQTNPEMFSSAANAGMFPSVPEDTRSNEPPEVRFKEQLERLQEMGFWDKDENIRVLMQCHGNVNLAIERLLQRM